MTVYRPKPNLKVLLAAPRGFCAGVTRAIEAVENALSRFGAPVYVRHEIVHNAHVVKRLAAMGAVFVEQVSDAPDDRPLVFSAHGAPAQAYAEAKRRGIALIDAACPLVLKVHTQVKRFIAQGRHVIVIGHEGHPEILGVMGQSETSNFTLVESQDDAETIAPPDVHLAYVTQTTLSVDDTHAIIATLKRRFPGIVGPRKEDICYATSNRQAAAKAIADLADAVLVVGSKTSSNSLRLVEVAARKGRPARLIEDPAFDELGDLPENGVLGVTGGASAPEELIETLLARLAALFTLKIETVEIAREDVAFKAPLLHVS